MLLRFTLKIWCLQDFSRYKFFKPDAYQRCVSYLKSTYKFSLFLGVVKWCFVNNLYNFLLFLHSLCIIVWGLHNLMQFFSDFADKQLILTVDIPYGFASSLSQSNSQIERISTGSPALFSYISSVMYYYLVKEALSKMCEDNDNETCSILQ